MICFNSPLKYVSAFRSLGLASLLTVALLCAGCAETNEILGAKSTTQVEQYVLRSYAKRLDAEKMRITSCSLVQESPNKFKGIAYIEAYLGDKVTDAQQKIIVTTDADGYLIESDGEMEIGESRQR